jgi:hypothetical protein
MRADFSGLLSAAVTTRPVTEQGEDVGSSVGLLSGGTEPWASNPAVIQRTAGTNKKRRIGTS